MILRTILFISLFTLAISIASAQTNSNALPNNMHSTNDSSIVYTYCEVMSSFKTREYKSFEQYLINHLIYTTDARAKRISGYTYVEFIVKKDGSLSNNQIVKGRELYPSCDEEAIRVISSSPK